MRSQGGLPMIASNPPCGRVCCQCRHTPGNATSQCKKPSRWAMALASRHSAEKRDPSASPVSGESPARAGPRAKSRYAFAGCLPSVVTSDPSYAASSLFFRPAVIQHKPQKKLSMPRRSAVVSSTCSNSAADSCTSATSASDISSMRCIPSVAASAPAMAEVVNAELSRCNSSVASFTRRPMSESPQRRWWSRKDSQRRAHGKAVQPQRDLGQFDGEGVLVHAVDAAFEHHAPDDGLVGELCFV